MRRAFKVVLLCLFLSPLLALLLMLWATNPLVPPPDAATSARMSAAVEAKMAQLQESRRTGLRAEVRFNTDELNGAIQHLSGKPYVTVRPDDEGAQVSLRDDIASVQVHGLFQGRQVFLTVGGRVASDHEYLTIAPTVLRVGRLPLPIFLLRSRLQRWLAHPDIRERLKLPESVSDVRVERGELVVVQN